VCIVASTVRHINVRSLRRVSEYDDMHPVIKTYRHAHQRRNKWMKNLLQTHIRNVRNTACILHASFSHFRIIYLYFVISHIRSSVDICAVPCASQMGFKLKFVARVRFHLTLQRRLSSYASSSHEIVVRDYRNAIYDMVNSLVSLLYKENRPIFCTNGISVGRLPII